MINRSKWGGPANALGDPMKGIATSVTAHHSHTPTIASGASVTDEQEAILKIHNTHTNKRKFRGIGYNFLITPNGNVYEGRGWGRVGAHAGVTAGNQGSIGVCFTIDGTKEVPSVKALNAFRSLRSEGVQKGYLTVDHRLYLHCDWKNTECPGAVTAAQLRSLAGAPAVRTLQPGAAPGHDILWLQKRLGIKTESSMFGDLTKKAVVEFQIKNQLVPDGVVGPVTWAKLLRPREGILAS